MVSLRCKGRCGRRLCGIHIGGDAQSTEGPRRGPSRSVSSRGRGQEDPDLSPTATNPLAPAQTCRRPPAPGPWLVAAQTAPAPAPRSKRGAGWLPLERRRARGMRCCRPSGEAPISRRGSWPHVAARCCIAGGFASLMLSPSPPLSRPFSPREFPFCVSRLQICAARSSVTDRCRAAPSKALRECTCARCKGLAAYAMFRSWFCWRFMS